MRIDGLKIETEIAKRGLTKTAFAKRINMTDSLLYRILSTNRASLSSIAKIADGLDADWQEIAVNWKGVDLLRIRKMRERKGLSQAELAQRLNVSQSAVTQWETGTRLPATKNLIEIAKVLECTIDELFREV